MKVQTQIDELITLRASEWFDIMKNPSESERAAFIAWLEESRRHVQEFLEVAAIDGAVDAIPASMREDLSRLVKTVTTPVAHLAPRPRPQSRSRYLTRNTRWKRPALWTAACFAVVVGILWSGWLRESHEFTTGIGEQRTIKLADASVVALNASSQLHWRFNSAKRDVELRSGEAIFTVAPDTQRPFRVRTRAGVVQVLGTQFNVYARPNGDTRVSVLEGRVQITAAKTDSALAPQTLILKAMEEADIRADGRIQFNSKAIVSNTVAWRERRLAFSNVLLEDMVAEFNRYNHAMRLRLEDVTPGKYRFAGIFNADDPASLAAVLSRESDLIVEKQDHEIVIRQRH